tara:strand:- start:520 stop:915 length:396 start_codon:yes stop_codon:yes gene_type:complete
LFLEDYHPPNLFTFMKSKKEIKVGDLVCFDGDEEGLLLGVGLVADVRGDIQDILDLDSAVRDFYDEEEFWRLTHILPAAPMILVLWSRSPSQSESNFDLYNIEKIGYSFMWVYPTEVSVISSERRKKKNGK